MILYVLLAIWIFVLLVIGLIFDEKEIAVSDSEYLIGVNDNNRRICELLCLLSFLVLWYLTAFRSNKIGNDTQNYIYYFNAFERNGFDLAGKVEIGYQFFNILVGLFSDDPHIFIIVSATVMYLGLAVYIFKYSKNILVSFCLFFCFFFSVYVNTLRQGMAMIIVLYAYQYLKKNKNIIALLLIIIAVLFHKTALLALLLFLQYQLLIDKRTVILGSIIIAGLSITGVFGIIISFVFPWYSKYTEGLYASSGWLGVSYEVLRNTIIFFIAYKVADYDNCEDRLFMLDLSILLLLSSMGFAVNLATRASQFFLLIAIVEFPNILVENRRDSNKYWLFGVSAVSLLMFLFILWFRPEWNHLYPYELWGSV